MNIPTSHEAWRNLKRFRKEIKLHDLCLRWLFVCLNVALLFSFKGKSFAKSTHCIVEIRPGKGDISIKRKASCKSFSEIQEAPMQFHIGGGEQKTHRVAQIAKAKNRYSYRGLRHKDLSELHPATTLQMCGPIKWQCTWRQLQALYSQVLPHLGPK